MLGLKKIKSNNLGLYIPNLHSKVHTQSCINTAKPFYIRVALLLKYDQGIEIINIFLSNPKHH